MKIHRFYLPKGTLAEEVVSGKDLLVTDEGLIHQWSKVLRFTKGDSCVLFAGDGREMLARFVNLEKRSAKLQIEEVVNKPHIGLQIALVSAVIRKERYEWLIEKGTELGTQEFFPVLSARSEEKLYKPDRLEKISIEAAEQSGRVFVPKIHPIGDMDKVIEQLVTNGYQICVLDFDGGNPLTAMKKINTGKVAFVIGPEGGWALEDRAVFASLPHEKIVIGNNVLRAETAAVAAVVLATLSGYQE